jgi:hypothetical protein
MGKSAQTAPAAQFDPALSRYIVETLGREQRWRRLYETARVSALLLAALLACQLPYSRSGAADTLNSSGHPALRGVVAFASPPLRNLSFDRPPAMAPNFDRLRFTESN